MMDSYFVVGCSADGLTFDGPLTGRELEKRLAEDYYGGARKTFATKTPKTDGFALQMGENELFIIRGHVVQPKPKDVVTHRDLGD